MSTHPLLRRGPLGLALAVIATAVAVTACGPGEGEAGGDSVTLRVISSKTGYGGPYGTLMGHGSELAISKVNADGGIGGKQVSMEVEDDGSDPARAVTILQRVAPDASIVVSNSISAIFAQIAPVANDLEVPLLQPSVSASALVSENRPWSFTTFPNLTHAVPGAVEVWRGKEDVQKAAIIFDNKDEATKVQAELYESGLREAGVEVGEKVAVSTQDVNFGAAVERVLRGSPDGVIVSAWPEQAGSIVRALRSAGPDVSIFTPTVAFVPSVIAKVAGEDAIEGIYTVLPYAKDSSEAAGKFAAEFEKKAGMEPDSTAAFAYEEIFLLQQAAEDGAYTPGDPSPEARTKLREYLTSLDWEGPFGRIVMGEDGIVQRDFYVLQVRDGGPELVETLKADGTG